MDLEHLITFSVMEPGMREVNIMSLQLKKATLYIQIQILVLNFCALAVKMFRFSLIEEQAT